MKPSIKSTRSRLLSTTVLPLAVVAAMGMASAAYADSHEGGCNPCAASCSACNPCNPCGAACSACSPCNPCGACNPCNPCSAQ